MAGSTTMSKYMNKSVKVPFRTAVTLTLPNATTAVTLYRLDCSNLGDRINRLSDEFLLYKINKLRVTATSNVARGSTTGGYYAISCRSMISTTAYAAINDLVDDPCFSFGHISERTKLSLPRSQFSSSMFKWYYTRDQGDDVLFEAAEIHVLTSAVGDLSANILILIWEGEVEFKLPIDGDLNPSNLPITFPGLARMVKTTPGEDVEQKTGPKSASEWAANRKGSQPIPDSDSGPDLGSSAFRDAGSSKEQDPKIKAGSFRFIRKR